MIERAATAGFVIALLWVAGVVVGRWSRERFSRAVATQSVIANSSGLPQILSFYGPRCGACDTQKQIIDQLRLIDSRKATVRFVDAVAESDYAMQFGVIVAPTTIVASATGRIVGINRGLADSNVLSEQLKLAV